jgi:hypothetical protein
MGMSNTKMMIWPDLGVSHRTVPLPSFSPLTPIVHCK